MMEAMLQPGVQRIKVGVGIGGKRKNLVDVGIRGGIEERQVLNSRQMVSRASLVADRKHEILRQRLLHLERVKIRVRYRHVGRVRIDIRWALIGENCRQTIGGVPRRNQRWISRVAQWIVAGAEIERDLPIHKWSTECACLGAATDTIVRNVRGIISSVVEDIVVKTVIGHSESP